MEWTGKRGCGTSEYDAMNFHMSHGSPKKRAYILSFRVGIRKAKAMSDERTDARR